MFSLHPCSSALNIDVFKSFKNNLHKVLQSLHKIIKNVNTTIEDMHRSKIIERRGFQLAMLGVIITCIWVVEMKIFSSWLYLTGFVSF